MSGARCASRPLSPSFGDGVVLFGGEPLAAGANQNLVEANTVIGNAANGIRVEARNNRIIKNRTSDNGSAALGPAFDLYDLNEGCDNNVWRGNTFETAFPACTRAGAPTGS